MLAIKKIRFSEKGNVFVPAGGTPGRTGRRGILVPGGGPGGKPTPRGGTPGLIGKF